MCRTARALRLCLDIVAESFLGLDGLRFDLDRQWTLLRRPRQRCPHRVLTRSDINVLRKWAAVFQRRPFQRADRVALSRFVRVSHLTFGLVSGDSRIEVDSACARWRLLEPPFRAFNLAPKSLF